eukprot:scaffold21778_cov30-Prasinocladus_malaysianus.AAC.1
MYNLKCGPIYCLVKTRTSTGLPFVIQDAKSADLVIVEAVDRLVLAPVLLIPSVPLRQQRRG